MPDLTAIAAAAGGLRTAGQIVKSMIDLKIGAEIQGKVIELQGVIMSAQGDALAAQSDQFTLFERIRDLEAQVAAAKAWEDEQKRYMLQEFPTGVFAYVLRPDESDGEPSHRICPQCYQGHIKSILQVLHKDRGGEVVECHRCKSRLELYPFPADPVSHTGHYT